MKKWKRNKPKRITVSVTEELFNKFNIYCRKEDITKQDLLEEHLQELFNKIDKYFEN